jgi:hypothetical protein
MNRAAAGGELGGPEFVEPIVVVAKAEEAQGGCEDED